MGRGYAWFTAGSVRDQSWGAGGEEDWGWSWLRGRTVDWASSLAAVGILVTSCSGILVANFLYVYRYHLFSLLKLKLFAKEIVFIPFTAKLLASRTVSDI